MAKTHSSLSSKATENWNGSGSVSDDETSTLKRQLAASASSNSTVSPYTIHSLYSDSQKSLDSWADEMDAEDGIISPPRSHTQTPDPISLPPDNIHDPNIFTYNQHIQHARTFEHTMPFYGPPTQSLPYYHQYMGYPYMFPPPICTNCSCHLKLDGFNRGTGNEFKHKEGSRNMLKTPCFGKSSSSSTDSNNDPRYKTKMCRQWQETGSCGFNTSCRYAHGASELRCNLYEEKKSKKHTAPLSLNSANQLSNLLLNAMRLGVHSGSVNKDSNTMMSEFLQRTISQLQETAK